MAILTGLFLAEAALLAIAGAQKTRHPSSAIEGLREAGCPLAAPIAILLGPVEIVVGGWALLAGTPQSAAALAALYLGFLGFLLLARKKQVPCGCFGAAGAPAGPAHIAINVVGAAVGITAIFAPVSSLPDLFGSDPAAGIIAMALLATGIYAVQLLLTTKTPASRDTEFRITAEVAPSLGERLASSGASLLGAQPDRRTFLTRTALVGTALMVAPTQFIFRPGTAYAAICNCSGQGCACGSLCCDGYTEFCCTIYGDNTCPPGSVTAGWWKVDASSFCSVGGQSGPRYYVDCNAVCESGCDSSGFCSGAAAGCQCGCAGGDCNRRKACCTKFRYGQCNQHMTCIGPIVCRVVTCVPPWVWDATCRTTSATDNNTRWHDAACLRAPDEVDGVLVPGGIPVVGDWDGDGLPTPGIFADGRWYLTNRPGSSRAEVSFAFGQPGDIPVVGDWFGDGWDSVGVFRAGRWFLARELGGEAQREFMYGLAGDFPVAGDWDGDGRAGIGVVRGGRWYLNNAARGGVAEYEFSFGLPGDIPVVGDWHGAGAHAPGIVRGARWMLAGAKRTGAAEIEFEFGAPGDIPVAADWDQDGAAGPGVVRGGTWYLRNSLGFGPGDQEFVYGTGSNRPAVARPLAVQS